MEGDDNEEQRYLMTLNISDLITTLRTSFRLVDYDRVEEILVERENKLKAEIKERTEKLELERLLRMDAEEKCKERYERLLESSKTNNKFDHESVVELRIQNTELEDEKRRVESVAESWKRKFEELRERVLMVEEGVNSFMNGNTHVRNGGKAEELSNARGTTDPGVSDEVMGEKDKNVVDICDNGETDMDVVDIEKGVNSFVNEDTHVGDGGKAEESSNIQETTNSGVSNNIMGEKDINALDICNNAIKDMDVVDIEKGVNSIINGDTHVGDGGKAEEVSNIRGTIDSGVSVNVICEKDINVVDIETGVESFMNGDTHMGNGRKSEELSSTQETTDQRVSDKVMGEKDMSDVDICENERGNTTLGSSPLQRNDLKAGNTRVSAAEVTRQFLDCPNKALLGASANARLGLQKEVIEIEDDDDDECIVSGALNRKEATRDTAATNDDIEHSSSSGLFESLKRKWFPKEANSFDGLSNNRLDGSDADDDDSSSSSSSLESRINEVQLPKDFLVSIGVKRRKT